MAVTDEQAKFIQQALEAAVAAEKRGRMCAAAGLTVLAREWDYIARTLSERVLWQKRALDGEFFREWKGGMDAEQPKNTGA